MANACDAGGSPAVINVSVTSCFAFTVMVAPVPASSTLTVQSNEDESGQRAMIEHAEILSNDMQVVRSSSEKSKQLTFDIANLQKGVCFVRVTIGGKTTTTRILIE